MIVKARPRTSSGTSWRSGKRIMRATDVTWAGAVAVHSRQACRTSAARSGEKNRAPA